MIFKINLELNLMQQYSVRKIKLELKIIINQILNYLLQKLIIINIDKHMVRRKKKHFKNEMNHLITLCIP